MGTSNVASFWHTLSRRTCIVNDFDMHAPTEDGAHLRSFVDSHFAMVEPVTTQGSDGETTLKLRVTPIPYAFVAAGINGDDECGGVRGEWIDALGLALYGSHTKSTEKTWEAGMMAVVALHAQAHADAPAADTVGRKVGPCLDAVLPEEQSQCYFSSDAVKHWRIPIAKMRRFECTAELWPAQSETLVRLSCDVDQEAVEGSLELVDDKGQRAVGWCQNKLYAELSATDLAEFIGKIQAFHHAKYDDTPMCAILFCTGNTVPALRWVTS